MPRCVSLPFSELPVSLSPMGSFQRFSSAPTATVPSPQPTPGCAPTPPSPQTPCATVHTWALKVGGRE